MKRGHAVQWSLLWALYETLHGQTPKALLALQAALETADDNMHVRQHALGCPGIPLFERFEGFSTWL